MIKFLANENFPSPSIRFLREKGYFIDSIAENSPGLSDELVLQKAVENQSIILTFDSDYGELLFKYQLKPPPAIIYFRVKGNTPLDAGKLLHDSLKIENLKIEGFLPFSMKMLYANES